MEKFWLGWNTVRMGPNWLVITWSLWLNSLLENKAAQSKAKTERGKETGF